MSALTGIDADGKDWAAALRQAGRLIPDDKS